MTTSKEESSLRTTAYGILQAAIARVDPAKMAERTFSLGERKLSCAIEGQQIASVRRGDFDRLLVIGFGKAAASMAEGVEAALGELIADGLVVTKYGSARTLRRTRVREAGHPVPDQNGIDAAREIAELAESADERTLVINLISGGGSALLTLPYRDEQHEIPLADMQATTESLLRVGADITEINTIRRHISAVKGGRLAALLHPAQSISIVLSDVVGDELSSIASGPTVPDESTYAQAREIVTRYGVADELPASVAAVLEDGAAGKIDDTPGGGDPVFASARTAVVGSNIQALRAASRAAEEAGFRTLLLSSRVEGEAREIAHFYTALAADAELMARDGRPLCIIAGGETTVTVRGEGAGGRNQEMAAAALLEMSRHPDWFERRLFMAASTDGNDGPTDAAGGFADLAALQQLAPTYREGQAELRDALSRNDSYELLSRAGALVKTGPTGTNVCDIQIVLLEGER